MDTNNNAFELIDFFAKELLALNGNKKIPAIWRAKIIQEVSTPWRTRPPCARVQPNRIVCPI